MLDDKVIEIIRVFIKGSEDRYVDIVNSKGAINIDIINNETVCVQNAVTGKIFYLGSLRETTIYRTYEMVPGCKEGEKIDG